MGHELQEIEIAERLGQPQVRHGRAGLAVEYLARARVDREHDRQLALQALNGREHAAQDRRIVDVGGPVQGQGCIGPSAKAQLFQDRRLLAAPAAGEERVDHDVADQMDALGRDALAA